MKEWLFCASILALSYPATSWAQENQEGASADAGMFDIIVTAEKRSTKLQKTPLAISAITGEGLEDRQISGIESLGNSLPNVSVGQSTGNARIAIRGIGFDNITVGSEQRVAIHLDGAYLSRPSAAMGAFFDLERVEVVRGPQGILYGRNATAGAINLVSRDPADSFGGYARLTGGNYSLFRGEGALNAPLGDDAAMRIAFTATERDGYGRNVTTGQDIDDESSRSVRGKLKYERDAVKVILEGDYRYENDSNYGFHYLGAGNPLSAPLGLRVGGTVSADRRDTAADIQPQNHRELWGTSLTADIDLGVKLTSITAYRDSRYRIRTDLDATSAPLSIYNQDENSKTFSQELRLSGDFGDSNWVIGGYYFHEKVNGGTNVPLDRQPVAGPRRLSVGYYAPGTIKTNAGAVFGQLSYGLTPELSLVVGGRYSFEKKSINEGVAFDPVTPYTPGALPALAATLAQNEKWNSFTPKVAIEFEANSDVFLYASVSKGFKSGGFNLGGLQPPFAPEQLWDYEAGIKADWLDGRLRTNLSAFYYDYKDLQVSKVSGAVIRIENAAKAKIAGIEAEITALPMDGLELTANAAFLDSEYKNFTTSDPARPTLGVLDLSGNDLNQSPHYSFNLAAQYTVPVSGGEVSLRGEASFIGNQYFSPFNVVELSQPAYETFNAFLSYRNFDRGLSLSAFVRNISNQDVVSGGLVGSGLVGSPVVGTLLPPRTYGVVLGIDF